MGLMARANANAVSSTICVTARQRHSKLINGVWAIVCLLLPSGADCMGLMARAARMAARQGREAISEDDIYAAMENKAMEAYAVSTQDSLLSPFHLKLLMCLFTVPYEVAGRSLHASCGCMCTQCD
jgi:hypothetical protein